MNYYIPEIDDEWDERMDNVYKTFIKPVEEKMSKEESKMTEDKKYVIKVCYKNVNDLPTIYHHVVNYYIDQYRPDDETRWLYIKFITEEGKPGFVRIAENYISRWVVFEEDEKIEDENNGSGRD